MRRPFVYPLAWALATSVVVGSAWLGINSALGSAVTNRATPLSAAELREAVVPSPVPTSASPQPPPAPSTAPSPTQTTAPPTSPVPAPAKTSQAPSPTQFSTPEGWLQRTDDAGNTEYKRTFHTIGGEATVVCAQNQVAVSNVVPKANFTQSVEQRSPLSVIIDFAGQGERRAARIYVRWVPGTAPYGEVTETVGTQS